MPTAAPASEHLKTSPLPRKIYPRPPIVEAVIDIHIDSAQQIDVELLPKVYAGEESTHLAPERMVATSFNLEPATGRTETLAPEVVGYRLFSITRDAVAQIRRNGMAFSKLPPYSNWDEWKITARSWWNRYVRVVKPTTVTRLAVRYVNRIDIPEDAVQLEKYLTVYPATPEIPSMAMQSFAMRLEIPQVDLKSCILIVQQGPVVPPRPNVSSVLLDLDLFQTVKLDPSSESIWNHLEALHARENDLFESFITSRARSLFE